MSESEVQARLKKLSHLSERNPQGELAHALGCTRQSIHRWLRGTKPQLRNQTKIEKLHEEQFATESVLSEMHVSGVDREVAEPTFGEFVEVTARGEIPIASRAIELVSWPDLRNSRRNHS